MCARRILFADNDIEFLTARTEILERSGYQVTAVGSLAQAERTLADYWFHLAILDVRLIDDYDERDLSGLKLAKQEVHRCIPKIVLTKFPEYFQEALNDLSPILKFVAKGDDTQTLLGALESAFTHQLRINWNLGIQFNPQSSINFLHLASLIESDLESELVLDRARELEDIFRQIFYESNKIRIDRLLWHRKGRVALMVIAFKENNKPESYLVICGPRAIVRDDLSRYKEYAPKAHAGNGTILVESSETVHYAALIYALSSNNLENFQTLHELYRFGPERVFHAALTSLFQDTLYNWHKGRSIPGDRPSLDAIYLDRLRLSAEMLDERFFDERLRYIERYLPSLGVQLIQGEDKFSIRYSEKSYTFPHPFDLLSQFVSQEKTVQLVNVSGNLAGDNVLVDDSARTWLTDFSEAGLAPLLWSYISLESAIRFDWVEANEIFHRHELEVCLTRPEYERLNLQDLEPTVRKPARAIQTIRRLAVRSVGREIDLYHRGILFHALRRGVDFDVHSSVKSSELARMAHIFISIAILTSLLTDKKQIKGRSPYIEYPELRIEPSTNTVLLGEQRRRLAPRPFLLLKYLYDHAGQVCTNQELRQNVIGENYNSTYIHTLVGRIRETIETNPEHAVYLVTEPNIGYKLIPKP